MNKRDIGFGVLFIIISIFLFRETFNFYNPPQQIAEPALWPRIMLVLLVILSLGLIYSGIKNKPEKKKEKSRAGDTRVILAMVATVLFLEAFKPLGFVISVLLYYIAITLILEPTKDPKTLGIRFLQAAILVLFIHFVFGKALSVRLPHGILPRHWFY